MRALVTGSTGMVGRNLVQALKAIGIDVHEYCRGDFINLCSYKGQFDYIFHCAAELYDEYRMIQSNIELTDEVISITKSQNYKAFIHIGSSSEYGMNNSPLTEQSKIDPIDMYGITKATSSQLAIMYAKKYNKPITVVRPTYLYGPYEKDFRLIPSVLNSFKWGRPDEIKIYEGSRDRVYVQDFVDAIIKIALSDDQTIGDVVNIGTGISTSNLQVYNTIVDVLGRGEKITEEIHSYMRPYDREIWVCNPIYAKEKYGIECKTMLREGIEKYIQWRKSR